MKYSDIISYCCGTYENGNFGGVARFENDFRNIFPDRIFFKGPEEKGKMLKYLARCKNPIIVTDNHLSCDIPNRYMTIIVHHGCAEVTSERNPTWGEPWKSLCTEGQRKMLKIRDPSKSIFVSTSISCKKDFERCFGKLYTRFKVIDILLTSELDESIHKKTWNKIPVVMGSWSHVKKGKNHIENIKKNMPNYKFDNLSVKLHGKNYEKFFREKQDGYIRNDIYLLLSNSEGTPYAALDALCCGLVVIATNVGIFEYDVPDDCFVKMDWRRVSDPRYVKKKVDEGWSKRYELGEKGRKWYLENASQCQFVGKWGKLLNSI